MAAQFYRQHDAILVRFPEIADFLVPARTGMKVRCKPVPGVSSKLVGNLFHNAVVPLMDTHAGRISLHGSGVIIGDMAVAFVGHSRSGKTTLAGAFARAGHPFLTEDAIRLAEQDGGYLLLPARPVLRLFDDSATFLSRPFDEASPGPKSEVAADASLPFADKPAPLGAIMLLGNGKSDGVEILSLSAAEALQRLLQHSFILDVEDKSRLAAHFDRIGDLSSTVPCFALDYPRHYDLLPEVIASVRDQTRAI